MILKLLIQFSLSAWSRIILGLGTRIGSTRFCTVLRHKTTTKVFIYVFSFDLNNKLNDLIVWSLVRNGSRVFHDFMVGQILYGKFEIFVSEVAQERAAHWIKFKSDPYVK